MTTRRLGIGVGVAAAVLGWGPPAARADWTADLETKHLESNKTYNGKIYFKDPKSRMENEVGGRKVVMLTEKPTPGQKKASMKMLMDERKSYMEMEFDTSKAGPACMGGDVDRCLTDQGFKKKGKETVEGQSCQVFEKVETQKDGKKIQHTIWRPTAMNDVGFVKSVSKSEGNTIEFRLKNFKSSSLDSALFEVPAGYSKFEMPKGFAGMMKGQAAGAGPEGKGSQAMPNLEELKKKMMKGMPGMGQ